MKTVTRKIVISALLLAADVLLSRVLALNTPIMKIGLGFAAVAVCGALYGPAWGALVAALGDFLGAMLFPTGAFFPGFTATAACTGLIYGLCFRKTGLEKKNILIAAALNCVLVSYLANSGMISFLTGNSYLSMLATRAVQLAVMLPLQIAVLMALGASKTINGLIELESGRRKRGETR